MGEPVSVIGHFHVCPAVNPGPTPHIGGPVQSTQSFVRVNGAPIAVTGAKCLCVGVGEQDPITSGSSFARIGGKAIVRIGDSTTHGGKLVEGSDFVRCD